MISPINIGDTIEYTLKGDKENPTIWYLGVLDSLIKTRLTDLGMVYRYNPEAPKDSVAEAKLSLADQELQFIRFGLKGFKNFKDKLGNEILFKTVKDTIGNTEYKVVSDETLKYIPRAVISELATKIAEENVLSKEETKN